MAPQDPLTDAAAAEVLDEIAQRLSALTTEEPDSELMASELSTIRDQLRRLGESNAEVGRWIHRQSGPPPDEAA
jgi:hypothetical protein